MNYYSESKLIEEDFVKNTIFTLPTQNIKLMDIFRRKKYGQPFLLYKKIWKMNSTFTGAICIYMNIYIIIATVRYPHCQMTVRRRGELLQCLIHLLGP